MQPITDRTAGHTANGSKQRQTKHLVKGRAAKTLVRAASWLGLVLCARVVPLVIESPVHGPRSGTALHLKGAHARVVRGPGTTQHINLRSSVDQWRWLPPRLTAACTGMFCHPQRATRCTCLQRPHAPQTARLPRPAQTPGLRAPHGLRACALQAVIVDHDQNVRRGAARGLLVGAGLAGRRRVPSGRESKAFFSSVATAAQLVARLVVLLRGALRICATPSHWATHVYLVNHIPRSEITRRYKFRRNHQKKTPPS